MDCFVSSVLLSLSCPVSCSARRPHSHKEQNTNQKRSKNKPQVSGQQSTEDGGAANRAPSESKRAIQVAPQASNSKSKKQKQAWMIRVFDMTGKRNSRF